MMGKNANISSQGKSIPPQRFHLADYFSQVKYSLFKTCTVQADKVNQFQHYISGLCATFIGLQELFLFQFHTASSASFFLVVTLVRRSISSHEFMRIPINQVFIPNEHP